MEIDKQKIIELFDFMEQQARKEAIKEVLEYLHEHYGLINDKDLYVTASAFGVKVDFEPNTSKLGEITF